MNRYGSSGGQHDVAGMRDIKFKSSEDRARCGASPVQPSEGQKGAKGETGSRGRPGEPGGQKIALPPRPKSPKGPPRDTCPERRSVILSFLIR